MSNVDFLDMAQIYQQKALDSMDRTDMAHAQRYRYAAEQIAELEWQLAEAKVDAERYQWLCDYMTGTRTDFDDAFVAAETKDDFDAVIDDARSK